MHQLILTFSCNDTSGIVYAVSGAIVGCSGNITELQQFSSTDTGRFFMRVEIDLPTDLVQFTSAMRDVARRFEAQWEVSEAHRRARVLLLVSKAGGH